MDMTNAAKPILNMHEGISILNFVDIITHFVSSDLFEL